MKRNNMEYRFRGYDVTGQKGWVYGDLSHSKKILCDEPFLEDRVMVVGNVFENNIKQ